MLLVSVVFARRLHALSSSDKKVASLSLVGESEEDSDSKAAFHVDSDDIGIDVCPVDLGVVESPARILVSGPSSLLEEVYDCSVDD